MPLEVLQMSCVCGRHHVALTASTAGEASLPHAVEAVNHRCCIGDKNSCQFSAHRTRVLNSGTLEKNSHRSDLPNSMSHR